MKLQSSSLSVRRARALESFKTASDCIGKINKGMSLFAITRGQFSMIDAILAVLDKIGVVEELSIWTWVIAEYEIECIEQLMSDGRIKKATLIVDFNTTRDKSSVLYARWRALFGADSIKYVINHAKIVCIKNDNFKLLLRGSFNLNSNPRFEQFDITEGGLDFDLVKKIESELPVLPDDVSKTDVAMYSKIKSHFEDTHLDYLKGLKEWKN